MIGKIALVLYLIGWTAGGAYLLLKFGALFKSEEGPGHDTAGSTSLSGAHFGSIWFGGFALGAYFLFK